MPSDAERGAHPRIIDSIPQHQPQKHSKTCSYLIVHSCVCPCCTKSVSVSVALDRPSMKNRFPPLAYHPLVSRHGRYRLGRKNLIHEFAHQYVLHRARRRRDGPAEDCLRRIATSARSPTRSDPDRVGRPCIALPPLAPISIRSEGNGWGRTVSDDGEVVVRGAVPCLLVQSLVAISARAISARPTFFQERKSKGQMGDKRNAPRPRLERSSILERRRAGIKALVTVGKSDGSSAVLGGDDP